MLPRDLKRDILSPSDFSLKRMHIWGNASVDMVNPWPGCVLPFKRLPLDLHRKARYNFSFFPPRKYSQNTYCQESSWFSSKCCQNWMPLIIPFSKKRKKERQIYRSKKWSKLKIKRRAFKWFELRQLFQFVGFVVSMLVLIGNYLIRVQQQAVFISVRRSFVEAFVTGSGGRGEIGGGGARVISISGGKQGYFAWHGYIVFRFAAVPSIFDATDKRNRRTLYDEDRPHFDVSCSDFVARSRVITRHQKDFPLAKSS